MAPLRLRVGVLELLVAGVPGNAAERIYGYLLTRQYAGIMSQTVSAWCRRLGCDTTYATYHGQAEPHALLPAGLDVVLISAYTRASALAYALARLFRAQGAFTVLGGPHAKSFPHDARRFFDAVVQECDESLLEEILRERPTGVLTSRRRLLAFPSAEERLPELRVANFVAGRAALTTVVPLLTSVGCPYACDFCTDWNNPYAPLPLDRLEEDLRFVSGRLPHAKLAFQDPNFAIKFDPVLDVLERIPPPRRPRYFMESSLSVLRGARLARLRDTRCWYVAPGIESWTEYSNKSATRRQSGAQKLDRVVEHFEEIRRYVPGVQANFIFGLDVDRGDEPLDLTRAFMSRAPWVWPTVNIPTPFGGTPLYDRYLAEGRVLRTLPFAFYYAPYLAITLKHYDPESYYARLVDLFEHLTSQRLLRARMRSTRGLFRLGMLVRTLGQRSTLAEFRRILSRLRSDARFRAFHEGETRTLPSFYAERFAALLGPYAALLTPDDARPVLEPASALSGHQPPGESQAGAALHLAR